MVFFENMRNLSWCIAMSMILVCSCNEGTSVNATLRRAEIVMFEHPDSALRMIRTIDKKTIRGEKTRALYALRYSQALDKNVIDVADDSLMRIAVDYYVAKGSVAEKGLALYYLGRIYENAQNEDQSIDMFVQAEVFLSDEKEKDPYSYALVCYALATRFSMQQGYSEALEYYRKAETYFAVAGCVENVGWCCKAQGSIYYTLKDLKMLKISLQRTLTILETSNALKEEVELYRRWLLFIDAVIDDAKVPEIKRMLLQEYEGRDMSQLYGVEYSWLAYLYLKTQNVDSARYYQQRVFECPNIPADWRQNAYVNLCSIEKMVGNYQKALMYSERAASIQDSIHTVQHASIVQITNRQLFAEQIRHDLDDLRSRHRYQQIIAAMGFLLAALLLWQLVRATKRWRRKLHEQHEADVLHGNEMLQQLSLTYEELQREHNKLIDKVGIQPSDAREARFSERLEVRLVGLKNLVDNAAVYKNKPAAFFSAFSDFATVNPNTKKEAWADLQYVVNKKFGGVVDYLRKTYPSLRPHDLDLCCMICFGFSPSGICFIYGYEDIGSFYNKRSRLRQKLQLTDEQKLEDFFADLCARLKADKAEQEKKWTNDGGL